MTQEEKNLLLRDLSARLPYGVKLGFYASATNQTYICTLLGLEPQENEPVIAKTENGSFYMLAGNVKPYLFPMSSMTEEERAERIMLLWELEGHINEDVTYKYQDWLNKHHFDYRGLIPMGLAIDASGLNIYDEKINKSIS